MPNRDTITGVDSPPAGNPLGGIFLQTQKCG